MTKAAERARKATEFVAERMRLVGHVIEPSGNVEDGWIFSFTFNGQNYLVEICAEEIDAA